MSAKPGKKKSARPATPSPVPPPAAPVMATGSAGTATVGDMPPASSAWIDSTDPRRRMIGKLVLIGVWIYVVALWLLALDQTFNWGIFGPKVPPIS